MILKIYYTVEYLTISCNVACDTRKIASSPSDIEADDPLPKIAPKKALNPDATALIIVDAVFVTTSFPLSNVSNAVFAMLFTSRKPCLTLEKYQIVKNLSYDISDYC